jgi:hypothetical protein
MAEPLLGDDGEPFCAFRFERDKGEGDPIEADNEVSGDEKILGLDCVPKSM